jgi:hypothetical protein
VAWNWQSIPWCRDRSNGGPTGYYPDLALSLVSRGSGSYDPKPTPFRGGSLTVFCTLPPTAILLPFAVSGRSVAGGGPVIHRLVQDRVGRVWGVRSARGRGLHVAQGGPSGVGRARGAVAGSWGVLGRRRMAGGVERPGAGGGGGSRRRVGRGRRPDRAGPGGVEGAAVGGRGAGGLGAGTGAQLRGAVATRGGGAQPANGIRPATRPRGLGVVSGSESTTRPQPNIDTGGGFPPEAERSEPG